MAGTVTTSHDVRGHIRKLEFTCVADAANASFPDTALPAIEGRLLALKTKSGATAPTDLYDVTIEDQHGVDVLQGVGANRPAASGAKVGIVFSSTSAHPPVDDSDTLTLKIANNLVNSAAITIVLYYALGA